MKNVNAHLVLALLGMVAYVAAPAPALADSPSANSPWQFDYVFNCGAGVPGSVLEVFAERGGSGRTAYANIPCDSGVWTGSVDGWVGFTIVTGSPMTMVTLDITINGDLCGTTTVKKSGPGPSATLPPELDLAWATLSCGGVALAVYGPHQ